MDCSTRNSLVWSYLRSEVDHADAESAVRAAAESADRDRILLVARAEMIARRKALLEHCEQHGC
jgi:hypothetical protein